MLLLALSLFLQAAVAAHNVVLRSFDEDKIGAPPAGFALAAGRDAAELPLRLVEGAALLATRGFGATEVEATYTRALALGLALRDGAAIGPALPTS